MSSRRVAIGIRFTWSPGWYALLQSGLGTTPNIAPPSSPKRPASSKRIVYLPSFIGCVFVIVSMTNLRGPLSGGVGGTTHSVILPPVSFSRQSLRYGHDGTHAIAIPLDDRGSDRDVFDSECAR